MLVGNSFQLVEVAAPGTATDERVCHGDRRAVRRSNLARVAVYRAGGADPGVPVRALAETRILTETTMFDIRVSEIAAPAEGDTIEVHGTVYVIQGEAIRDAERLVWTIEARPA